MPGLLIFDHDWADEYDVSGFMILNKEDYIKFLEFEKNHPEFFNRTFTWCFGTNEEFESEKIYSKNYFSHQEISEEEYNAILRIFNLKYRFSDFGQFPYILDDINDYLNEAYF